MQTFHKAGLLGLSLALSVLPASAQADLGDNQVGINIHNGEQATINAVADMGAQWVRVDGNWWQMETSKGSYQWGPMDNTVNQADTAGLQVYMTLAYTPDWVSRRGDTDGEAINDIPTNRQDWVDFVEAAVTHYRGLGVKHFGIWNEPNLTHFFEGSAVDYVNEILVPGAAAVRRVCMDCVVLGPDLATVGDWDDFMDDILTNAPAGSFDIIAHHSYNGFPELGTSVFDGDRYFNVLDQQRFAGITRRSLRQLLDKHNYQGEVWMSETGYRADNIGDADDEMRQARYSELVLGEMLSRNWVTNTFFYEITDCGPDQPGCTIDGYGLLRPTSGNPGQRSFPADYRIKPAFDAIKNLIATTPALQGAPAPACGDGIDNDNDGQIDGEDRGCTGPDDNDESDDPMRPQIQASALDVAPQVDGDLMDLQPSAWTSLDASTWQGSGDKAADDLSARLIARWGDRLYLGLIVRDDTHINSQPIETLWLADSVQLAFDVGAQGGQGYDGIDDHELSIALVDGQAQLRREAGPAGASDAIEVAARRVADETHYEIAIAPSALPGLMLQANATLRFTFLVNEADGQDREGWLEWTPGIGQGKQPEEFGEILLVETATPGMDPAPGQDMGAMSDMGSTQSDMGPGSDMPTGFDDMPAGVDMGSGSRDDLGGERPGENPAVNPAADESSCTMAPAEDPSPSRGWLILLALAILLRRRRSHC